jgi:voltage-gated potassium channel
MVTMTTVGYGDVYPKTHAGRIFAMGFTMTFGIGIVAYLISLLATTIIERESKFMNGQLDLDCEGHIIIFNMQHEQKIHALMDLLRKEHSSSEVPIVLVDPDLEKCPDQLLKRKNFYYIKGNPLWSVTMGRANAIKAQHAILLAKDPQHTASDGITLQIAVVLKDMHKDADTPMTLVAEVVSADSIEPLQLVGVRHIVCLEQLVPPVLVSALNACEER